MPSASTAWRQAFACLATARKTAEQVVLNDLLPVHSGLDLEDRSFDTAARYLSSRRDKNGFKPATRQRAHKAAWRTAMKGVNRCGP
jgi:hypothetical protein